MSGAATASPVLQAIDEHEQRRAGMWISGRPPCLAERARSIIRMVTHEAGLRETGRDGEEARHIGGIAPPTRDHKADAAAHLFVDRDQQQEQAERNAGTRVAQPARRGRGRRMPPRPRSRRRSSASAAMVAAANAIGRELR